MRSFTRYLLGLLLITICISCSFVSVRADDPPADAPPADAPAAAPPADAPPAPPADAPAAPPADAAAAAPAAAAPEAGAEGFSTVGLCEVCMYVVENKMQHQPYLCKGLKDPNYQQICVQVMESLMWWVSNEVYWVNYGCQMNNNGAVQWVRPCPAHAICSWIQHLYLRKPYCAADPNFPKPA